MKTCGQIMTQAPTCCLAADTVYKVANLMKTEGVGAVPVVESEQGQRLIGIITDRDLALKVVAEERPPRNTRVVEVMSVNPITCHADDDVQYAIDTMAQAQVRRIPVVDDNGRVLGIIAQADVAIRLDSPQQTAAMVEEISRP